MPKKAEEKELTIYIPELKTETIRLCLLGRTPMICNRMSEKAKAIILDPPPKKNQAEKQATTKHQPFQEYRDSPYTLKAEDAPTFIAVMSSAVKGAMAKAALDIPGAKKAQIERLVYAEGDYTAVYGKPYLFMAVVRQKDIEHTPDIRTRAILPEWAMEVEITYVVPTLNQQSIVNLLSAAGQTIGIGDWRQEKGKGNYGLFRIVDPSDPTYRRVLEQGRSVQIGAMESPETYDEETERLLAIWQENMKKRGRAVA